MVETQPCLEDLACEIGNFIRFWGFKRIHGKIWTHIYLSQVALDAGTLMKRLNVSKALMSLSLHDLLEYDVIRVAGKSEKGTQVFVANPDIGNVIINVLKKREKSLLSLIEDSHGQLRSSERVGIENLCPHRLDRLGHLIRQAHSTLEGFIELANIDMQSWKPWLNEDSR